MPGLYPVALRFGVFICKRGVTMSKCKICGRGPQFGHNVSHSMRHTKRRWNINIQRTRLTVDGKEQSVAVCTKCLKTLSKAQ